METFYIVLSTQCYLLTGQSQTTATCMRATTRRRQTVERRHWCKLTLRSEQQRVWRSVVVSLSPSRSLCSQTAQVRHVTGSASDDWWRTAGLLCAAVTTGRDKAPHENTATATKLPATKSLQDNNPLWQNFYDNTSHDKTLATTNPLLYVTWPYCMLLVQKISRSTTGVYTEPQIGVVSESESEVLGEGQWAPSLRASALEVNF